MVAYQQLEYPMSNISHLIRINANTTDTFRAITSSEAISKWFTDTECDRWEAGSTVTWFGETDMTITDYKDDECVSLHVNRGGGWDGTDIRFSVEADADGTIVRFDHSAWDAVTDHFRDCSMSWAYFLESLKQYVETGIGTPEGVASACETA